MNSPMYALEFFPGSAPAATVVPRWSLKAAGTFLALGFVVLPLMLVASLVGAGRHRD